MAPCPFLKERKGQQPAIHYSLHQQRCGSAIDLCPTLHCRRGDRVRSRAYGFRNREREGYRVRRPGFYGERWSRKHHGTGIAAVSPERSRQRVLYTYGLSSGHAVDDTGSYVDQRRARNGGRADSQ